MATLDWRGDDILARVAHAKTTALSVGAQKLLDESNRVAPIETGALIRSGTVVVQGDEAAVGYTSVYAARQHEEVGWAHDDGRQAKYLENALTNNADEIERVIADRVRNTLGG